MKQEKPQKKQLIKPEMLIAAFAILISISTLIVYIYQSNLMKQQQKMSVWPYLNYGPSWGQDYFIVDLINKGIGPAIIENVTITFDGKEIEGIEGIMKLVPDSIRGSYSFSTIPPGLVIMAGEALTLLNVTEPTVVAYLMDNILNDKFHMEVCYSSVYGDSWISYGLKVEESNCK
ncbi:MAG: hypothetical protein EA361_00780 [Bacteroidetes bacterium]|nr:MAG: hypothetical protein EA361_00780 [Bacteroidota bacterium]